MTTAESEALLQLVQEAEEIAMRVLTRIQDDGELDPARITSARNQIRNGFSQAASAVLAKEEKS